jgi:hypothetical protein
MQAGFFIVFGLVAVVVVGLGGTMAERHPKIMIAFCFDWFSFI